MSSPDKTIIICSRCRCKRFADEFTITRLGNRLKTCSSCREKAKKIIAEKKAKAKTDTVHVCLVCDQKNKLEK